MSSAHPFETHPTPDQTIVVMLRGEQRISAYRGNKWFDATYRAGTVGMTAPGVVDRLQRHVKRQPHRCEKANIYVPQRFFSDAAEHFRKAGQRLRPGALTSLAFDDPLIGQTAMSLLRAITNGAPNLYAEAAMQNLAVHLLSVHGTSIDLESDRRRPGVISDRRLARVLEYMGGHAELSLSLDELAGQAALSKYHFVRVFREHTGVTPHAYLVQLRLDAAQRMLLSSDLSVSTVATMCGFVGAAHFSTTFRRRYGLSPTQFRNEH